MRLVVLCSAALVFGCFEACTHPAQAPEEVVRLWQSYIDHNQFDSARVYSTELARSYVDFIDALTQGDTTAMEDTKLYHLQCHVVGDSAVCHYLIEGEIDEKIPDTLVLRWVKGRWLVDRVEGFMVIPVDTLQPGDEDILFRNDSMDAELQ